MYINYFSQFISKILKKEYHWSLSVSCSWHNSPNDKCDSSQNVSPRNFQHAL